MTRTRALLLARAKAWRSIDVDALLVYDVGAGVRRAWARTAPALKRRSEVGEAAVALGLMGAGIAQVFSFGAALIVTGSVIFFDAAIWPRIRRR